LFQQHVTVDDSEAQTSNEATSIQ